MIEKIKKGRNVLLVFLIVAFAFSFFAQQGACYSGGGFISLDFTNLCFIGIWGGFIAASLALLLFIEEEMTLSYYIVSTIFSTVIGIISAVLIFYAVLLALAFISQHLSRPEVPRGYIRPLTPSTEHLK